MSAHLADTQDHKRSEGGGHRWFSLTGPGRGAWMTGGGRSSCCLTARPNGRRSTGCWTRCAAASAARWCCAADPGVSGIAGVESEISMEFGGLHQLLVPFLPRLSDLPPPQRGALRVAFGREAGPPPESFLVGLATLTLLSRAAEEQPLLCIIDDAHCLDPESAQVLGFVARRLYADRVGFIAGVGEPAAQQVFEQLPTITVEGLPDAEARELLSSVAGGALNAQAVDRILADTRNNPLALVELGTQYTADQLSGRAALPEPLPLGQRLREHFLRLVRSLPPDAQEFTLLAAADPGGERDQLWRAAAQAGIDPDAAAGGGYAARAALLRRAADLTPDDGRRAEREVALAEATLMAGDPAAAQTVLDVALPRLTHVMARGQAHGLEGAI